jgi:hypothetical protein
LSFFLHLSPLFLVICNLVQNLLKSSATCLFSIGPVCYVQCHMSCPYWSRSYTWQPIKGSNHCHSIQMLTTQQKKSPTHHNFSLHPKQIKTVTNSEKLKNNDEQVHHLKTLTVQNLRNSYQTSTNPTPNHQFTSNSRPKSHKFTLIFLRFRKNTNSTHNRIQQFQQV